MKTLFFLILFLNQANSSRFADLCKSTNNSLVKNHEEKGKDSFNPQLTITIYVPYIEIYSTGMYIQKGVKNQFSFCFQVLETGSAAAAARF